jgi:hypothetical protein
VDSEYYTPTAASATDYGQGNLIVVLSRGYSGIYTPVYTMPVPRRQLELDEGL